MDKRQLQRMGLIGLIIMALVGLFYFWSRSQKERRLREVPPDDRNLR
jgi:flagellar biosynthesis/type III secretory pathway M-ring protein FliF/YscJ